jgi:histidinol-phosphatase
VTHAPDAALALRLGPDLDLALSMADAADVITMDRFGALDLKVETKPDLTPVTEADKATEVALRAMLAEHRPDDSVLGEEFGTSDGSATRRWIIDPIDGTKNYVRGVPVWATLIALVVDGEVVVGVVSAPALARRWWAASGTGAWGRMLDREPVRLQVSLVRSLDDASLSYSDAVGWSAITETGLKSLLDATWRQRAYGDFWSHILVAEGAVDVAAEPELGAWDIAAIIPIVTEAGGRITAFDGRPALEGGCAVTTNGVLHESVLSVLRGDS